MILLPFRRWNGESVWINPAHVSGVVLGTRGDDGSCRGTHILMSSGDRWGVQETPDVVVKRLRQA